jgi:hypothetical protein
LLRLARDLQRFERNVGALVRDPVGRGAWVRLSRLPLSVVFRLRLPRGT